MNRPASKAVVIHALSRSFRGVQALCNVDLEIPSGSVFGLVGLNGAGKTTLIRHIIGSMKAKHGSVRVLGQDPTVEPEKLLARIGYMTEEDSLPRWMRVSDLISFCRSVYPTWSDKYASELCEMFSLSTRATLKSLSKGGRARAALLAAIAHRPELLILDEPSSGLDPIARADILEAIIRTIADEGRTVLFSSHLLEEIDRVCDHIALIHQGQVIETLSALELGDKYTECFYRTQADSIAIAPNVPGTFGWVGKQGEWSGLFDLTQSDPAAIPSTFQSDEASWELVDRQPVTVHRWFAGRVRTSPGEHTPSIPEAATHV